MRIGSISTGNFGRKNTASMMISVVLLALVFWMAHSSLREVQHTSDLSNHTQEVRVALTAVSESLLKMETGQRGFLLIGQEVYLEPYRTGSAALDPQLQQLEQLIVDND
jgi:CHASE3 domain sensor protein